MGREGGSSYTTGLERLITKIEAQRLSQERNELLLFRLARAPLSKYWVPPAGMTTSTG